MQFNKFSAARISAAIFSILAISIVDSTPSHAVPINYIVDRNITNFDISGTLTAETDTNTITDYSISLESTTPSLQFTLTPSNSTFLTENTTVVATATELTVTLGGFAVFGPQLRDNSIGVRHEWLFGEEVGTFFEQASINFPNPSPDQAFSSVDLTSNPIVFLADTSVEVPEPGTFGLFGIGLSGLALARRRRKVA